MRTATTGASDIARACERLIYRVALYLDDPPRRREIAELFTDDGVIEVPATQRRTEGHDAIADYFGAFPDDLVSQRLSTNVIVDVVDDDRAEATSYFAAFNLVGKGGAGVTPPPITQVGIYRDTFVRDEQGWRIARRVVDVTYAEPVPKGN